MTAAADILRMRLGDLVPRVAIVLGSGLGAVTDAVADPVAVPYAELPGFPVPTVSGHGGRVVAGTLGSVPVMVLEGRAHYYETGRADAMRGVIDTLAAMAVEALVLTNAAGSLREDVPPGRMMLLTDHINFSGTNPLIADTGDDRFVTMTGAYDARLQAAMRIAASRVHVDLAEGVYIWFSGPTFETPAEIRAARILGADAVGMSTVPEVILARRAGLRVAAISAITNLGAGMGGPGAAAAAPTHGETKDVGGRIAPDMARLLAAFCEGFDA